MLNKIPLLIMVLIIIFLITSLMTFIAMEKVVTTERVEEKPEGQMTAGIVKISIINPDHEKEGINNEGNIG